MADLASEFPIIEKTAYLNTAAQGPWPARTVAAVHAAAQQAQFLAADNGSSPSPVFGETRGRLASLLNVQPDDLVFGPNTTYGLNVCVHGIDWRAGDNVVVPDLEFPSVQYALAHLPKFGVEVRCAPRHENGTSVDALMARVDGRTRAVICSAITWDTGYRIDLATLGERCAAAGCLSIVDGIHAVGAECLDLAAMRVSALSFHSYKWLMAGFGNGVLYVAPAALDQIRPTFIGPLGVAGGQGDNLQWQPGAQRYATGTMNKIGTTALNSSLSLIEEIGMPAITAHNHALADALDTGLRRLLPAGRILRATAKEQQSAIVVFSTGSATGDAELVVHLTAQNVVVALRPAGIRVAPHLFNSERDVERLLAAVASR